MGAACDCLAEQVARLDTALPKSAVIASGAEKPAPPSQERGDQGKHVEDKYQGQQEDNRERTNDHRSPAVGQTILSNNPFEEATSDPVTDFNPDDCDPVTPTAPVEEGDIPAEAMAPYFKEMSLPKLTHPAPDFSGTAVIEGEFKEIKLSDYKGKYLVLFFYPLDFTFVCPTEIIAFSDRAEEFRKINCEIVACSTDSHFCHLAWINTSRKEGGLGNMNIPLLADKSCTISRAYGVLKEDEGIPFRGLFIIDDKQRLRQITVNDLPVGRSVDETLRLVQAFQFTDKHGEVCPANWKPGGDTMRPDPVGSKAYFSKH